MNTSAAIMGSKELFGIGCTIIIGLIILLIKLFFSQKESIGFKIKTDNLMTKINELKIDYDKLDGIVVAIQESNSKEVRDFYDKLQSDIRELDHKIISCYISRDEFKSDLTEIKKLISKNVKCNENLNELISKMRDSIIILEKDIIRINQDIIRIDNELSTYSRINKKHTK